MAKENYIVFNPEGGLGKIIASTALIPFIIKKYPEHKLVVVSPWAEIFLNNPKIYRCYKSFNTPYFYKDYIEGRDSIVLKGEPYFQPKHMYQSQHLIKSWCDLHDLEYNENEAKPEIFFTPAEVDNYAANLNQFTKPILIFQTNGGPYDSEKSYSWTRDFPIGQAQILTNELSKVYEVIQIAKPNSPRLQNAQFIENVDNKRTFIATLLKSSKRLLIDSCLQHAAAAFNLPSTVCWIGTSPKVFGYSMHTNIMPNIEPTDVTSRLVDAQFFDNDFNGPEHDFPYPSNDIFKLQDIVDSIQKN